MTKNTKIVDIEDAKLENVTGGIVTGAGMGGGPHITNPGFRGPNMTDDSAPDRARAGGGIENSGGGPLSG